MKSQLDEARSRYPRLTLPGCASSAYLYALAAVLSPSVLARPTRTPAVIPNGSPTRTCPLHRDCTSPYRRFLVLVLVLVLLCTALVLRSARHISNRMVQLVLQQPYRHLGPTTARDFRSCARAHICLFLWITLFPDPCSIAQDISPRADRPE
jgi:hypothetical protein